MANKKQILIAISLFITILSYSQDYKTYKYFANDSIGLNLDLFLPITKSSEKTPLVIFVHGGGFKDGNRDAGHSLAKHLVNQNIASASISYTQYMSDKNFSCDGITSEKVKAIQIAANQLWLATAFLIEKSDEINIDASKVFISGSSAGAETVLHAAFWDRKQMQLFDHKLTPEFKYAGIISGSGAIMDLNLINKKNKIPLMAFHGDSDSLVPYATASHHYCLPNATGWLMFFGSYSIAQHLHSLNESVLLTSFKEGGHRFASEFFNKEQYRVSNFIQKVLNEEKFTIYETIKP